MKHTLESPPHACEQARVVGQQAQGQRQRSLPQQFALLLFGSGGALVFAGVNQFGLGVVVAANVFAAQGAAPAHAAA